MKQLLTLLILAGTLSVSAQKVDSAKLRAPQLTDSTDIISVAFLQKQADSLKDVLTARQFETFMFGLNKIVQEAIAEWNRKHQPKQK